MENCFEITRKNLGEGAIVSQTITIKLSDNQLKELREVAVELDETIESLLEFVADKNLVDKINEDCFISLLRDKYINDCLIG